MLFERSFHGLFVTELDIGDLTLTPIVRRGEVYPQNLQNTETHSSVLEEFYTG
jgi:hypothetical protein